MSTNKIIEDDAHYKLNTLLKLESKCIHNWDTIQMPTVLFNGCHLLILRGYS